MKLHCLLLLGIAAGAMQSADLDVTITPRVSLGYASGIGLSTSEFQKAIDGVAGITGASASGEYTTKGGLNLEVPVLFGIAKKDSPAFFICGPALIYSANKNDFKVDSANIHEDGTDDISAVGGKLYVGLGLKGGNNLHVELLPYIGAASVSEKVSVTARNSTTGASASSSSTNSGSMTLYGITAGVYFTPETASKIQIGARLGYVGAKGTIENTDYEQSGGMIAVEVGFKL